MRPHMPVYTVRRAAAIGLHLGGVGEAVHLRQQLVQRLVALIIPLSAPPNAPDRINLVHKDDGWCQRARLRGKRSMFSLLFLDMFD